MTLRVDFDEWQRVRQAITAAQTRILVPEEESPATAPASARRSAALRPEPSEEPGGERPPGARLGRPTESRPLHSHRPRTDEEWRAIADGVRALVAEQVGSGRWRWVGPRRVVIHQHRAAPSGS